MKKTSVSRLSLAATLCAALTVAACGGGGSSGSPATASPSGTARAGVVSADRAHYESVMEMLRGRVPGLEITETGAGAIEVHIRGVNQSMQDSGQPLVVVDGVPQNRPAGDVLLTLNPVDVASINVLKDVSSTSIYGTKGANGVILVQLKRRG